MALVRHLPESDRFTDSDGVGHCNCNPGREFASPLPVPVVLVRRPRPQGQPLREADSDRQADPDEVTFPRHLVGRLRIRQRR